MQDTLVNLQVASQFQTRFEGNRKEYSIESSKGWELLFETVQGKVAWFNWRAYGRTLQRLRILAHAPYCSSIRSNHSG